MGSGSILGGWGRGGRVAGSQLPVVPSCQGSDSWELETGNFRPQPSDVAYAGGVAADSPGLARQRLPGDDVEKSIRTPAGKRRGRIA